MEHLRVRKSVGNSIDLERAFSGGGRGRRWFLAASAAVAVSAAGASVLPLEDLRGEEAYDDAIRETWRHSGSFDLPWPATQRELVRYAALAANNHNSQPWRFQLFDRSIVIVPNYGRRGPSGDFDGRAAYVSVGCAVENLVQAAAAFGLRAVPSFDSGAISIAFEAATRRESALFGAIPDRSSTRGPFDGRPADVQHLRLLEAAAQGEGVTAFLFTAPEHRDVIAGYASAAAAVQMDDANFVGELKRWIRLDYRDAVASRDGLFVKTYGLPVRPAPVGGILLALNLNKNTQSRVCQQQIKTASGIAVFVPERGDPAHWVEVGRSCERFALQAAALGMMTSFISPAVEVPAVRDQFAANLGIGPRRPDAMLRFGYGRSAPRSLRRPVEQIIIRA